MPFWTDNDVPRASGQSTATGDVTLVAGQANKRILLLRLNLNAQADDTVVIKNSGGAVIQEYYLAAKSNGMEDYGDMPIKLAVGESLVMNKSAASRVSWSVRYAVVDA